jgi:hypothetical protein
MLVKERWRFALGAIQDILGHWYKFNTNFICSYTQFTIYPQWLE